MASPGLWKNGGKGINFIFCWEPPMIYLAWKVLGTTRSFLLIGKACHPRCFISTFFRFELWHLYKSILPSTKGLSIYFYVESSSSKISTRTWEHCFHAYALCVANVGCIMTGSFLPWIIMFSHCLNFGGAMHLSFAVSERASEIPLLSYYIMVVLTMCCCLRYIIIAR